MNTDQQVSDTETITYIPRRVMVVRENAGDVEVLRATASYHYKGKTHHAGFNAISDQLEGRCYTVEGYGVEDDASFWLGRRYNWTILLYPGCPDHEHFCSSSPVPVEHALGME